MIIKNEIPILEYDDCYTEVISPDHDLAGIYRGCHAVVDGMKCNKKKH